MEENAKKVAELLKLLSNENRLMILCVLIQQERSVGDIAKQVPNIKQSALSQHLNLLKTAGILNSVKIGQNIIYSIADERIGKVIEILKVCYCQA